jgi:hypothetical protein
MYPVRQRFLIVCEGKKTEPLYFIKYRAPGLIVRVEGEGCDPIKIVDEALRIRNDARKKDQIPYDQVWCVFDRDSNPIDHFNKAILFAQQNHINVAYSNQSFELWYLLHFHLQITSISRRDYIQKLGTLLGHTYKKDSDSIYDELLSLRADALHNSHKLLSTYKPLQPANDDPSTTVHLLVEQLIQYAGPLSQN